ncbi:MAG TPA: serpin family protein [Dongiaceae bacterium]|jgi:serpin B|nr:serpin family protein [Dongiaceae bacterium]
MPTTPDSQPARQRLRYFLIGMLFEILLVSVAFGLPETGLGRAIQSFVQITHIPLTLLLQIGGASEFVSLLVVLLMFLVLSGIWGYLIFQVVRWGQRRLARFSPRQQKRIRYSLGIASVTVAGAGFACNLPTAPEPFHSTPEIESVVAGNTSFALDVYRQLKERQGNVFFAPYGISSSLAIAYAGARGRTESELAKVLHFDLPQDQLDEAFEALARRMKKIQRWHRITLLPANSLWGQAGDSFKGAFLNSVRIKYHAGYHELDFQHSPTAAVAAINHWASDQTRGKIPSAVNPEQISAQTRLVVASALYFKGTWKMEFEKQRTQPAPFYVTTNQTVPVPMMRGTGWFKTTQISEDNVELLELPYVGQDLSLIILQPPGDHYAQEVPAAMLPEVETQLTCSKLQTWLRELDRANPVETSVSLPRFITSQNCDLTPVLKTLGLTSAFDNTADFSGMDGTMNLFLTSVLHQSFVEINESGTEAAATTVSHFAAKSISDVFIVDHPFLFLIRDNGSGSILFFGRIMDPTQQGAVVLQQ